MDKKVSIVMTAYNRKKQVLFTLETIKNSAYKNIEIIIVDDASDDAERLDNDAYRTPYENELYQTLSVLVIRINKEDKTWVNPCMSYNIGLRKASGDIIIIQNAEVCHIGDCISYVASHLKRDDWLTLNCYGLSGFEQNNFVSELYHNNQSVFDYISKIHYCKIGGSNLFINNPEGWLNHSQFFFTAYHYFGAIYRSDLIEKMGGGFCEEYQYGTCYDDNDFIKSLIHCRFRFTSTIFKSSNPFVIHQYHDKCNTFGKKFNEYHSINKAVFHKRMMEIGASIHIDIQQEQYMPLPVLL